MADIEINIIQNGDGDFASDIACNTELNVCQTIAVVKRLLEDINDGMMKAAIVEKEQGRLKFEGVENYIATLKMGQLKT